MSEHEQIVAWAQRVDWRHTQAVVCVGYHDQAPWETLRKFRSDLVVFCFDPEGTTPLEAPPDGRTFACRHLVDLRTLVGAHIQSHWKVETMGPPHLAGRWGPLVTNAVDEAIRWNYSMELTTRLNAVAWTKAGLALLPKFAGLAPLNAAKPAFDGVPAVIVGAGPSLSRNVHHLAEIQDRVVIIATNSALGVLEDAGVQPDVVCIVEVLSASLEPVLNSPLWKNAVLVPGVHATPKIFEAPARAILPALQAVGPVGAWLHDILKMEPIHTGGSVSTMAFRAAEKLGCSPIILVGMDCARGATGEERYADGVRHAHSIDYKPAHRHEKCTAWGGVGFVLASPDLAAYREWFETQASTAAKAGKPIINATEGGAQIADTVEKRLRDIDLHSEPKRFFERLDAALDGVERIDGDRLADALEEQLAPMDTLCAQARVCQEATEKLLALIPDFIKTGLEAHILSGMSLGPIEEGGLLPHCDQLTAMRNTFARAVDRENELTPLIHRAVKALRGKHAKAA